MSHTTVEDRIHQLEQRLKQVEHAPASQKDKPFFENISRSHQGKVRFFGWAISTFALLGLITGVNQDIPLVGLFFTSALLIGLILIAAAGGLIAHSDSYTELAQEHRAGKKLRAHAVHNEPRTKAGQSWSAIPSEHWILAGGFLILAGLVGWTLLTSTADPLLHTMPIALFLVLFGVVATTRRRQTTALATIIGLTALLFVAPEPLTALMAALAGFAVIWIAAWEQHDFDILSWSGFGLTLVAFGQAYWNSGALSEPEIVAVVAAALMGLMLAVLPFAPARRDLDRRDSSRALITLTPLATLTVLTSAGPYTPLENLLGGLMVVALGYAAMAYVGWLSQGRLSYAKYFLVATLGALLLFVYLLLDTTSVTLIWFILGVVIAAVGFSLPSYTARLLGLGLLAIAVLHYIFTMLGVSQVAGPLFLRDRVWVGVVIAMFLPALALWYQQAPLKGIERRLVPVIANTLSATGFLILFAVAYLDLVSPYQPLAWLIISAAAVGFGRYTGIKLLVQGGCALIVISLLQLITSDIFNTALDNRVLFLLGLSLFLIALGFILPMRTNRRA